MKAPDSFKRAYASRNARMILPAAVMVVTALICLFLSEAYRQSLIVENRASIHINTDEISTSLSSRINARYALLNGLAAMITIHREEGLEPEHFEIYARSLKAGDPIIRSIQFYPAEGKLLVYPLEGNEAIANYTLEMLRSTKHAGIGQDVERAITTRQITLSDPYSLLQGGYGIAARLAVYDGDEFLGLAVITLNHEALLSMPGLTNAALSEVNYAIRDTKGKVFYGDDEVFSQNPETSSIILPEGAWTLGAVPEGGWGAGLLPRMAAVWAVSLVLVLLSGFATYLSITNQQLLKKTVEEQYAALIDNESRFFLTFEVIHEGVWDWDIDKRNGFASDNFFSILGAENKDFTGLDDVLPCIHPEDRELVRNQMGEGINAGSDFDIHARLATKRNNREIHILIRGRVVDQDADGKALRMLGTVSDITDQKKAEEDLRESETKFRAVFNNNHAVMLLIDPESGAIIDANPAACGFYGYSQKQLTSRKISDINTLNSEEIKTEMQHAARESRSFFNFRHRLANGDIRDVEVFSGPIAQKNRALLFSIVHDVTARKQAEKALVENENRLRFALEGANDGLWTVNLETDEMGLSPRGCEILGYTANEYDATKMTWDKLVIQEDHPAAAMKMEDYVNGRVDLFEIETRMRMKTGGWKWVLTRGKALERGPDGQILTMTGTLTDISLRKQSEEKMLAAQQELKRLLAEAESSRQVLLSMLEDQKAIEEQLNHMNISLEQRVRERTLQLETINNELEAFSYSVSHDLRAPLRGIDGWSLALVEDYGEQLDENARDYLCRVRNETQRMGQLIDDLLRLSRVTRMELIRSNLNLSVLASAIADRLQVEYKDRPPVFVIEPNITTRADSQLMDIVLTNLLSNACKFSARHDAPRVEFGTIHVDGRQAFFVRDNGVGFDSDNAKKLFGAFQRMHRQSDFPGTGIGLATVKRIINRHGGQVWAESQKDQGATFYFTLPEVQ